MVSGNYKGGKMEIQLWQIVLVTFVFLNAFNVSGSPAEHLQELKLKAKYHLHSFKRDLDDIRAIQDQITNSEDIEIRSIDGDLNWDLYLSPILAFCEDLKKVNVSVETTMPPSTTVSPHRDKDSFVLSTRPYQPDGKKSEWYLPPVRPIRAQAERDGTKVRLIFDVLHSSPAYAVRSHSFQYAKAEMDVPAGAPGKFISQVQFVTDASACRSGNFDFEEFYEFIPKDLNDGATSVRIDVCGFDKYQNMSLEFDERTWLTRNETIEENPKYPKFRIVPTTNSDILARKDRNTKMDVVVRLDSTTIFIVSASFYDYVRKTPIEDSVVLRVKWSGGIQIERSKKKRGKIIRFKVMKSETSKNKTEAEDPDQNMNVTGRITVLTSGTRFGNLVFQSVSYRNEYYQRALIETVALSHVIRFNKPGKSYPPPDLEPRVRMHNITICTEEGNSVLPREGPNCTLSCNAFGPNITSISITKTDSKLIPVRSVSYVLNYTAFSMIDVGPASEQNEGSYLCVVENSNGHVESSATLYTSGVPKIISNESTLVQFDNGTSELTCKSMGAQPLRMKMNIKTEGGEYSRIDNNRRYSATKQRFDKGTILKLRLPTTDLKFPQYIINCESQNNRGYDAHQYYLYHDVEDYYGPVVPKLDKGSTRIESFVNGTTAITCKASGAFPLDVMVLYGGRGEYFRIDKDPSNIKMEKSTTQSKTATLLVKTTSIKGPTSWLHCFAKNKYGDDILDYDLDDYI